MHTYIGVPLKGTEEVNLDSLLGCEEKARVVSTVKKLTVNPVLFLETFKLQTEKLLDCPCRPHSI